jgi:hypothetical protein
VTVDAAVCFPLCNQISGPTSRVEAQEDWCEAYADLAGERVKLQAFAVRSMASGAAFHCAYLHATQQPFLEAHETGVRILPRCVPQVAL